jgi:hypothetical protein
MKDPSQQIRTSYFNLINPIIPLFDGEALENAPKPYAIITIPLYVQGSNKDLTIFEDYKVVIDIVTDYKGQKKCEELSQLVLNAICPTQGETAIFLNDFNIGYTKFSAYSPPTLNTLTGRISRKILSFYHNITG